MITEKNIFEEINKGNYFEVLKSDLVDKVKDDSGKTPLQWLAWFGVKEILDHPSVDSVGTHFRQTPLHWLAYKGVKEVLSHPSVDKVKDGGGSTPLQHLAHWGHLTKKDLRKKYPWYKKEIKGINDILKAVKEIVNTPKSIQFILED